MKTSFINTFQRDIFSAAAGNGALQAAANTALPGSGVILSVLGSLFGSKPNPNDWKGWDAQDSQANKSPGTSVVWWVINDGDSVQNEALNAISYMRTKTQGVQKVYEAALEVHNLNTAQFTAKLVSKLTRAGYPNEAAQFAASTINTNVTTAPIPLNKPGAATPIYQRDVQTNEDNSGTALMAGGTLYDTVAATKAEANKKTWLIVGIIGGVIVLATVIIVLLKGKK